MGRLSGRESCELRSMMTSTNCHSILPPMRGSKSCGSLVVGHGGDVENEGNREKEGREKERGGDCRPERGQTSYVLQNLIIRKPSICCWKGRDSSALLCIKIQRLHMSCNHSFMHFGQTWKERLKEELLNALKKEKKKEAKTDTTFSSTVIRSIIWRANWLCGSSDEKIDQNDHITVQNIITKNKFLGKRMEASFCTVIMVLHK
ncbi:hypothetical protein VitviT2T_020954 [Vitis vinifera]|uniref:Uncharacterized protein n=1 Tax=Vitis vinifera TaxID=29760 RepID=A0ABY9D5F9_VITVI|nr:hypothetical protein VitviT2T_020954 [Vitis vinifera]